MNYLSLFLASFLIWLMFLGLIAYGIFSKKFKAYQVVHIFAMVAVALIVSQTIKELFPSPRPFVVYGTAPLTLTEPSDSAFPSSHTAAAFAMVFGMLHHNRKVGALFFPPALLVGYGRIMSNVHYPLDVIGGILVALLISILLGHKRLQKFFQRSWITT